MSKPHCGRGVVLGLVSMVLTMHTISVPALAASAWDDCDQRSDPDSVIHACTEVITQEGNPNRASAYSDRCWAYNQKGDYERAIADCTAAIELDPKLLAPTIAGARL